MQLHRYSQRVVPEVQHGDEARVRHTAQPLQRQLALLAQADVVLAVAGEQKVEEGGRKVGAKEAEQDVGRAGVQGTEVGISRMGREA